MLRARDENFLPVNDIPVSLANGAGFDARCLGPGIGFGHGKCLQAQFASSDPWKVSPLLFFTAVPKQRAHGVHLSVAGAGIAATMIDFFQNDARFRNTESGSSVLFWNQGGQISATGKCVYEFLGILFVFV